MTAETAEIADSVPGADEGHSPDALAVSPRPVRIPPGQLAAVASLVALPLLVYALPAALGHPVVPGDDLTQNLPLRELVGRDLSSGHLPVFDPYVWGGAPLLAGWNAGAAYPLTWLFAVLPGDTAWTVNLVVAAVVAGVGCYAFLRASRLGAFASWAGAMTYAFGGGMVAQIPHVGLVIGMSWVPVALLALLQLTDTQTMARRSLAAWTAVLSGAVGLVLLAGEPRAVVDGAAVLVVYGGWRLVRLTRRATWWKSAGAVVSGAVLGVGLGAVQLVPGLAAVATSQRAEVSAFLFGAGSLPVRWLSLLGVPDLLGGSGSFGQPVFFASYNLTEITGYVGLLPLVAAVALFAGIRRGRPIADWLVWEVVAAVGILLALGDNTPLWHVLIHIPLVGGQRLQSRGILVTDLALAVLLAYWLDEWCARSRSGTKLAAGRSVRAAGRAARVLGALPLLGVIGLVAAALAGGRSFLEWMGVGDLAATHAAALAPWLVPSLLLAVGALALVVITPRLAPTTRSAAAGAFVVVDLLVFSVMTVVSVAAPAGAPGATDPIVASGGGGGHARATPDSRSMKPTTSTTRVLPISALHLSGRFAVFDPGLLHASQLTALGVPDANVVNATWSIEGYGSIVDGRYAAATGVHGLSGTGQDVFSPDAAMDGVLDALSTQAVLAPSEYLITAVRRAGATAPASGRRHLASAGGATWFLGTPLDVRAARADVRFSKNAETGRGPSVRVGLLRTNGTVDWGRLQGPTAAGNDAATSAMWDATWHSPVAAVGLVVDAPAHAVVAPPVVTVAGGRSYELDGVLQRAMVAPHWRYGGQDGAFAVFVDTATRAPLRLRTLPGESLRGAAVRRLSGASLEPTSASVTSARGVEVVRAVAATPGWTATWTPTSAGGKATGPAEPLTVHRLSVVQLVRAPPGRGVVTWRYVPPGFLLGEVLSLGSLVVVAALLLAAAFRRGARVRLPT